jgi:hypothetical protein
MQAQTKFVHVFIARQVFFFARFTFSLFKLPFSLEVKNHSNSHFYREDKNICSSKKNCEIWVELECLKSNLSPTSPKHLSKTCLCLKKTKGDEMEWRRNKQYRIIFLQKLFDYVPLPPPPPSPKHHSTD